MTVGKGAFPPASCLCNTALCLRGLLFCAFLLGADILPVSTAFAQSGPSGPVLDPVNTTRPFQVDVRPNLSHIDNDVRLYFDRNVTAFRLTPDSIGISPTGCGMVTDVFHAGTHSAVLPFGVGIDADPLQEGECTYSIDLSLVEDENGNRGTGSYAVTYLNVVLTDPTTRGGVALSSWNAPAKTSGSYEVELTFNYPVVPESIWRSNFQVVDDAATLTSIRPSDTEAPTLINGVENYHSHILTVTPQSGLPVGTAITLRYTPSSRENDIYYGFVTSDGGVLLTNFGDSQRSFVTVFDDSPVPVRITGVPTTVNGPFTATVLFGDPVTGFEPADITVGNGAVTQFGAAPGGRTYTVDVTPDAPGQAVTIDIAADVAHDIDTGVGNGAAEQVSTVYDPDHQVESGPVLGPDHTTPPFQVDVSHNLSNIDNDVQLAFDRNVTAFRLTPDSIGISPTGCGMVTEVDHAGVPGGIIPFTVVIDADPLQEGECTYSFDLSLVEDENGNRGTGSYAVTYLNVVVPDATTRGGVALSSWNAPAKTSGSYEVELTFNYPVVSSPAERIWRSNFQVVDDAATLTSIRPSDTEAPTLVNGVENYRSHILTVTPQSGLPAGTAITLRYTPSSRENDDIYFGFFTSNGGALLTNFGDSQRSFVTVFDNSPVPVQITGVPTAVNGPFTATVLFEDPVTGFEPADITVVNGAVTQFGAEPGGRSYNVDVTPDAPGQAVTIDIAADVAHDIDTGVGNGAAEQVSTVYELTAPQLQSVQRWDPVGNAPFSGELALTDSLTWRLTFDETVHNVDAADFVIGFDPDDDTPQTRLTVAAVDRNVRTEYDVTATLVGEFEGTVRLAFAAEHFINDVAGNRLTETTPTTNEDFYTFDNRPPRVASIEWLTPPSGSTRPNGYTNSTDLTWRVTFSEPVNGVDWRVIGVSGGNIWWNPVFIDGVRSSTMYDLSFSVGPDYPGRQPVFSFKDEHGITDLAGNALRDLTPTGVNQNTYIFDTTAPTLSVSGLDATLTGRTTATFTFDEPVTGFDRNAITGVPAGAVLGDLTASGGAGEDGRVWTATLTPPPGEGRFDLVVSADGITDNAGNALAGDVTQQVTYDTATSAITQLVRHDPATGPTNADSLTWRMTFSEAVTNVTAGDFTVTGTPGFAPATAPVLSVTEASSGADTVWDITASGGALASYDGTVTLGLADGQDIADTNGNALDPALPTGAETGYTLDNTAPGLVITGLDDTLTGEATATFTFDEPVTGFDRNAITGVPGDAILGTLTASGGDGTDSRVWTATLTPPTGEGRFDLVVAADGIADDAGNALAESATVTVNYDTAPEPIPGLVVSTEALDVSEGSTTDFTVSLAGEPTDTVVVSIAKESGDGDLTVDTDPGTPGAQATLTFTAGDGWNTPQTVTIGAAEDADTENGGAVFTLTASGAPGYANVEAALTATEADNDAVGTLSLAAPDLVQGTQGTGTLDVTLSGGAVAPAGGLSLSLSVVDSGGNGADGITFDPAGVTIAPGAASGSVAVTVAADVAAGDYTIRADGMPRDGPGIVSATYDPTNPAADGLLTTVLTVESPAGPVVVDCHAPGSVGMIGTEDPCIDMLIVDRGMLVGATAVGDDFHIVHDAGTPADPSDDRTFSFGDSTGNADGHGNVFTGQVQSMAIVFTGQTHEVCESMCLV